MLSPRTGRGLSVSAVMRCISSIENNVYVVRVCTHGAVGGHAATPRVRAGRGLAAKQLPHLKWSNRKPPLLDFMHFAELRKE